MKKISSIRIYPIKSLGGFEIDEAQIERRGLRHDRRWMLVDAENRFLTQRERPEFALFRTRIEGDFLIVFHKNRPDQILKVPLEPDVLRLKKIETSVWDWNGSAMVGEREADAFFSDFLNEKVRLAYQSEAIQRQADLKYAEKGQLVSFADGFPFLLIGRASLDFLNQKLAAPVPMDRFRPNFVVEGTEPFEEDALRKFRIGSAVFEGVKNCGRCVMTTIDQQTSARAAEPLRTLASFRQVENRVLFGQNLVWLGDENSSGTVRVGD